MSQVAYLLLNFFVPGGPHYTTLEQHLQAVRPNLRSVGVWLDTFEISSNRRYVFRFQRYRRDDALAEHVAEAFHYGFCTVFGLTFGPEREGAALPLTRTILESSRGEQEGSAAAAAWSLRSDGPWTYETELMIGRGMTTAAAFFVAAWRIASVTLAEENLFEATRFVKRSIDNYFVDEGDLRRLIADGDAVVTNTSERSHLEDALQNAFKAIEALLGDPPSDDRKLARRIEATGLDPEELVGYATKRSILQAVRQANRARDKEAAHGSTPRRPLRILDVVDFQTLARHLVVSAVEHRLGKSVWPEGQTT